MLRGLSLRLPGGLPAEDLVMMDICYSVLSLHVVERAGARMARQERQEMAEVAQSAAAVAEVAAA